MDNTTAAATPTAADPATAPLHAALDAIRMWRHRQPHTDARRFAELDAILDAAALGRIESSLDLSEPTSLPEAVEAHQAVMNLRRRTLADAGRAWDLVEANAMRQISRFMPNTGTGR
ncbi:hypothetical protein [Streptomyces chryseus]